MSDARKKEIEDMWRINKVPEDERYIYVPCFSLNTIMQALNINKIDFFSLDVEGSEYEVLKSIDFQRFNIDLFWIEVLQSKPTKNSIIKHLTDHYYKLAKDNEVDIFMIKT